MASLDTLGEPSNVVRAQLAARIKKFEGEWMDATVALADIRRNWEYKPVGGKQGAQYNLYQIRPVGNIRVYLTLVDESRTAFYLEAHRKQGAPQQNRAIERCVQRAKRIWKEGQP